MKEKSNIFTLETPLGPVDQALAHFVSEQADAHPLLNSKKAKIGVAYSGGADSTALLLATYRLWPEQTYALHIHHGLQDAAEEFLKHSEAQCAALGVPFISKRVNAQHAIGESPEDAARTSRYLALVQMAKEQKLDIVLLGQHADDQVETLLIALSRGAGLPGLACMPAVFERKEVLFARPMLHVGVAELKEWLRKNRLAWVEDPTNQEKVYTRNKIRLDILPQIAQHFPSYKDTYLRSIQHIAQAQELLEELAQQDLVELGSPPHIKAIQNLSTQRQANALRYWLKQKHQTAASTKQLDELLKQIEACTTRGHKIHLRIGHGFVKREGQCLTYDT